MTEKQNPERTQREYPHSSGDRNTYAPTRDRPEPEHRGGTQRAPDPDPTANRKPEDPDRRAAPE